MTIFSSHSTTHPAISWPKRRIVCQAPFLIDISVPVLAFCCSWCRTDLTVADFRRVRRQPPSCSRGWSAPCCCCRQSSPSRGLFSPPPEVTAGLLLVAACPTGGISNTFSYMARASGIVGDAHGPLVSALRADCASRWPAPRDGDHTAAVPVPT